MNVSGRCPTNWSWRLVACVLHQLEAAMGGQLARLCSERARASVVLARRLVLARLEDELIVIALHHPSVHSAVG